MRRGLFTVVFIGLLGCPKGGGTGDAGVDGGAPLSITSIDPDHGPIAGGTVVGVNGTGFVAGASVVFGTNASASVTFESSRRLSAVAPPGPEGRASVTVVNPSGRQASLPAAFLYEGPSTGVIADAVADHPPAATDTSGADPLRITVKGEVKVPGVTDATGQGAGVRAQVGFAPEGSTTFAWVDAAWLADADLYDQYQGAVTVPTPMGMTVATYVLGVRFSVNNGASWVEGDRDGSAVNGVTDAQRPRVTVSQRPIDWCKLGGEIIAPPDAFDLRIGEPGPVIYGQVFAMGLTDRFDAGPGVAGELGVGDAGVDPALWTWSPATYHHDTGTGANDEFMATLPTSAELAGDKRFAFRFGISGGPWRYCDSDGLLMGGFTEAQAGRMRLSAVAIDQCRLQFPLSLTSRQGVVAGTVYGRVLSRGVTEAAGAGPGIEAQLGLGVFSTLPSDPSWSWVPATYNLEATGGFEEWQADLVGPAPGAWSYAYRFRYQGGPWTYCDSDPSDGQVVAAQLGALTAQAASFKAIAACKLQFVSGAAVASGSPLTAYGRVRVPGFSEDAGATPGLRGEVGVGTAGSNASVDPAWGWAPASFNVDVFDAGEDEWQATFTPAYTGSRAVSFRFAVEDGGWTYCDQNGSNVNGYEVAQQWGVTVGRPALEYCVLQFPPAADAGTIVYGQVYIPGVTRDAGASIVAELGYGREIEDPGVSSSWRWTAAAYNANCPACGNNNEYQAVLSAPADAGSYAYRFTYNGNTCYGDLDGAGSVVGGFNGNGGSNLGAVTR